MDFDVVVIGSGFGGSVSALRLTEKGYRVAVIEQGRRVTPETVEAADADPKKLMWMPGLGLDGFFYQRFFRHTAIVGGIGVGGGSIVYAAVLLRPPKAFYRHSDWADLGVDWEAELMPHYDAAERMLGRTKTPVFDKQDEYLKQTAEAMGRGETFGPTYNGIFFGEPGVTVPDPFFGGQGPERTGCSLCGDCLSGCGKNAKNSLDKNYLYFAEKSGAKILTERKVRCITPLENGGYALALNHPVDAGKTYPSVRARRVVVAGGVLGSLEVLFESRDVARTLPRISRRLGAGVRTNSEAFAIVLSKDPDEDLTRGPAITSDFYPDEVTHITQNRFPEAYRTMKMQIGPMIDDPVPWRRALRTFGALARNPRQGAASWFARNWRQRLTVFTVMQHLDNQMGFTYGKSLFSPFKPVLKSRRVGGKLAPAYIPVGNRAGRIYAELSGGIPLNSFLESVGNLSATAHILGGCNIAAGPDRGVIDVGHEVFGYPGLYVVDGSAISANVGVNPSLTITAMAERAMARIPAKKG